MRGNSVGMFSSPSVPPHALGTFTLFLRLPGYAETLLKDLHKACCLLRLALGVTDDGDGGYIHFCCLKIEKTLLFFLNLVL